MLNAPFRLSILVLLSFVTSMQLMAGDQLDVDIQAMDRPKLDAVNNYNLLIKQLATEHGPYDQRLSEPLLALGHALKEAGDYSEAVDIFSRAMHVVRINEGLYNVKQIPILENIIECNTALGNWDDIDDEYHYLLWVYDKTFTEPDPAKLNAIDKAINWHLSAFSLPTRKLPARHLLDARDLNETALEMAEKLYGESGTELPSRLYKLALADYFIAVGIQREGETGLILTNSLQIMNRHVSYHMLGKELVGKIYRKGIKTLNRIDLIYKNSTNSTFEKEAMAIVYLADWHLLFNKRGTAFRLYRKAYEILKSGGMSEKKINKYFDRPVILPIENFSPSLDSYSADRYNHVQLVTADDPNMIGIIKDREKLYVSWSDSLPGLGFPSMKNLDISQLRQDRYALAIFDISEKGWAEDIHIIEYNPDTAAFESQAQEALWSIQFRPKLVNGEAVSGRKYGLYYFIPE